MRHYERIIKAEFGRNDNIFFSLQKNILLLSNFLANFCNVFSKIQGIVQVSPIDLLFQVMVMQYLQQIVIAWNWIFATEPALCIFHCSRSSCVYETTHTPQSLTQSLILRMIFFRCVWQCCTGSHSSLGRQFGGESVSLLACFKPSSESRARKKFTKKEKPHLFCILYIWIQQNIQEIYK